jgi:hypothetical protein
MAGPPPPLCHPRLSPRSPPGSSRQIGAVGLALAVPCLISLSASGKSMGPLHPQCGPCSSSQGEGCARLALAFFCFHESVHCKIFLEARRACRIFPVPVSANHGAGPGHRRANELARLMLCAAGRSRAHVPRGNRSPARTCGSEKDRPGSLAASDRILTRRFLVTSNDRTEPVNRTDTRSQGANGFKMAAAGPRGSSATSRSVSSRHEVRCAAKDQRRDGSFGTARRRGARASRASQSIG